MMKREFFIFAGILFLLLGAYHFVTINSPESRAAREQERLAAKQKEQQIVERKLRDRENVETRVDVIVATPRWDKYGIALRSNHLVRMEFDGKIEVRGSAHSDQITFSIRLEPRKFIWREFPVRRIWIKSLESRNVHVTILQCPMHVCRKERFFDGAFLVGMTTLQD